MLTITGRAERVISLMVEIAPNASGIRLFGSSGDEMAPPALRLVMAYDFTPSDELIMTRRGVAVFIDPDVAPLLEGATIDGSVDTNGRPRFTAWRDEVHLPTSSG